METHISLQEPFIKKIGSDHKYRPLGYERVYLPLCKVADTPFHAQGDDIFGTERVKKGARDMDLG